MLSSQTAVRVRYAETDKMGFVYHGHYLTWFEVARVRMLDEFGCPYRDLEERGYFLPVLKAELQYRRPLTFDEEALIIVTMKEKPSLRIHLHYEVKREKETCATGYTEHAFIDSQGRPRRPPEDFLQTLKQLWPRS